MDIKIKREYILNVAEKLFCKYGSKDTTVRFIASEADINTAMLNYYFGSKENLFLMVVDRRIKDFRTAKSALAISNKSVLEELVIYTEFYIDLIISHSSFYKLMMTEKLLNENKKAVDLVDSYFKSNRQTLKDLINKGIEEKKIKNIDVDLFITNLSGFLVYIIFTIDTNISDQRSKITIKQNLQKFILSFIFEV